MGAYCLWLTQFAAMIFWLMDIMNMPFMEQFDTTYPLNGLFWFIVPILAEASKALSTMTTKVKEK